MAQPQEVAELAQTPLAAAPPRHIFRNSVRSGNAYCGKVSGPPAVARFLLEMIRVDEGEVLWTRLTISQNVSLGILFCVSVLWVYIVLRPRTAGFGNSR